MNILLINIVLLLLVVTPYLAKAQEGDFDDPQQYQQDPYQQQQQVTLTREAIERLLQLLSQNCRQEMESALAVQGDISDHCKGEVQEALKGFPADSFTAIPNQQGQQNAYQNAGENDFDNIEQQAPEGGRRRRAAANPSNSIVSPTVAIIAFVALLLGAVTGYVIYFNKVAAPVLNASAKPKKLSKKKVRLSFHLCHLFFVGLFVSDIWTLRDSPSLSN